MPGLKKRSKSIFMTCILLVLSISLSACSGSTGSQQTSSEPPAATAEKNSGKTTDPKQENPPKEPVTVTMWEKAGGMADGIKKAVEQFNSENQDIHIKLTLQGADDYEKNLELALQTGQAPDIFLATNAHTYYEHGWMKPLDEVMDPPVLVVYKSKLVKGVHIIDGKIAVIPTSAQTVRLIYNKDLFVKAGLDPARPPKTFGEVKEYAKKITEATSSEAYGFGMAMKWGGFMDWQLEPLALTPYLQISKKGLFNAETVKYEMEKYKPVISLYRELIQNKWAYPGSSTLDNDPMRSAFAEGKIGMYIGAAWDVSTLNKQFKTQVDWAAASLPSPDDQPYVNTLMIPGKGWGVYADTKVPQEAGRVLNYLYGGNVQGEFQKQGFINAFHPEAQKAEFFPEGEANKQFADFLPGATDLPIPLEPTSKIKVQGKSYKDVVIELILTDKPIDKTLTEISDVYNQALEKAAKDGKIDPEDYSKDSR
jgi:multiple sugar transport system substrate-binding protein